nr:hypothetical protein [Tanacetum cinerariifolium]
MHKAFPLLVRKFPLPEGTSHCLKKNAAARRKVLPLPEDLQRYNSAVSFVSHIITLQRLLSVLIILEDPDLSFQQVQDMDQQYPTVAKIPMLDTGKFEQRQFRMQQYLQHEHYALWERNRSDLDTMSLDVLYNHLKVYEAEVQKKSEPNTQNMAFISSIKHSRGNDEVNTASVYTASSNVPIASANVATVNISQETACAYIASQSSGSQIKFKDINQINEDDMEDMDIKWTMALLSMRADKFWKKTGKEISIQGSDVTGFDKSKVKCFNCHKMGHFARECRAPRNQERGRRDTYRQGSKAKEQAPKSLMAIDGAAILKTFGGNEATKKTKKNLLKQQYINFRAEGSETLEQTFTRLQVIVGQLQFMDVEVEQDDLNQKSSEEIRAKYSEHGLYLSTKHSRGNDEVNTASSNVPTASANVATISISQETACAYIASQSGGYHKMGHFARECRAPRNQERGRRDTYKQGSKAEEQTPKALMTIDGVGWDWSYMENDEEDHALVAEAPTQIPVLKTRYLTTLYAQKILGLAQVESRLVEYKEREVKYIEKIRTLEFYDKGKVEYIETLKNELETLKQEKEVVDGKLAGLLSASKNLNNLIESQRSDKSNEGLRYTVVPPLIAQLYLSPKKDLSWTGLPEYADDIVTDYSRSSPTVESSSEEDQNRNPSAFENVASPITLK